MTTLAPKNAPSTYTLLTPGNHLRTTTFTFTLASGDVQLAYISPQGNSFHPISVVFTDYTEATLEVTANSPEDITADTALWATITLSSDFYSILSVVTGIRITASADTVVVACC